MSIPAVIVRQCPDELTLPAKPFEDLARFIEAELDRSFRLRESGSGVRMLQRIGKGAATDMFAYSRAKAR